MAKTKKTESAEKPVEKKKSPAKTQAKSKSAAPSGPMLIDTNLAAQSAARMLTAGLNRPTNTSNPPRQESASFKQLKAGLNKPHSATMSNLLEKSQGPELTKSHPQSKQIGHNQTFNNADITRSGVPRRNPG
jgi:hypothetical protein